jgi:hypothetical protein
VTHRQATANRARLTPERGRNQAVFHGRPHGSARTDAARRPAGRAVPPAPAAEPVPGPRRPRPSRPAAPSSVRVSARRCVMDRCERAVHGLRRTPPAPRPSSTPGTAPPGSAPGAGRRTTARRAGPSTTTRATTAAPSACSPSRTRAACSRTPAPSCRTRAPVPSRPRAPGPARTGTTSTTSSPSATTASRAPRRTIRRARRGSPRAAVSGSTWTTAAERRRASACRGRPWSTRWGPWTRPGSIRWW